MNMPVTEILLKWYDIHKRDLPWRKSREPYYIWVSEIILQQTRVLQGMDYYNRFIETFPDIFSLAGAPVEKVLKVWEGLGYYSRARNMHETAQKVVEIFGGKFPHQYDELLKLKGIGPYTAAAIASIAYQQPVPLVDGNVYRVFSRLFGIDIPSDTAKGKKKMIHIATTLLPAGRPGDFNQAVMEFGALQCVPGKPDCSRCPLRKMCLAKKQDRVEELPVKDKETKIITRYIHYLVWISNGEIILKQRKEKDIWYKLYDFPEIPDKKGIEPRKLFRGFLGKHGISYDQHAKMFISEPVLHQLTHRHIIARFYHVYNKKWHIDMDEGNFRVPLDHMKNYAFPRLITAYMEKFPERFLSDNE